MSGFCHYCRTPQTGPHECKRVERCSKCKAWRPLAQLEQLKGNAWRCRDVDACAARESGDVETDDGAGLDELRDKFEASSPAAQVDSPYLGRFRGLVDEDETE